MRLNRFWTETTSTISRAVSSWSRETLETPMWRILPSAWSSLSAPIEISYGTFGSGRWCW